MPELPEVETIVKELQQLIVGHLIRAVTIRESKLIAFPDKREFTALIKDSLIEDVSRRGKYILIKLSEGLTMVIHLRMTGRLLVLPAEMGYDKHTHIIFHLDNGLDLRFHNLRKFGRIYLVKDNQWVEAGNLTGLGPEPLSDDFTLDKFKEILKRRKTNIKALLLKQDFIAGLGNIYTDEALFEAGILPHKRADELTDIEIEKLYRAIRVVLKKAIEYGGTTFSDYRNVQNKMGFFQNELMVYKREGKKCYRCGTEIAKERVASRGTHYCPGCQK